MKQFVVEKINDNSGTLYTSHTWPYAPHSIDKTLGGDKIAKLLPVEFREHNF